MRTNVQVMVALIWYLKHVNAPRGHTLLLSTEKPPGLGKPDPTEQLCSKASPVLGHLLHMTPPDH